MGREPLQDQARQDAPAEPLQPADGDLLHDRTVHHHRRALLLHGPGPERRSRRKVADPEVTIDVVGQKWSWTFNYKDADNPAVGQDVWEAGTINKTPDLYLPAGKLIQFNLSSPDVIHSFWVPSFYEKLDVIPGRHNSLQLTPTAEGVFPGKCAELCGTYHSAMLFNVHVVSENDYNDYLKSLVAKGQIGEAKGPSQANAPAKTGSEEGTR